MIIIRNKHIKYKIRYIWAFNSPKIMYIQFLTYWLYNISSHISQMIYHLIICNYRIHMYAYKAFHALFNSSFSHVYIIMCFHHVHISRNLCMKRCIYSAWTVIMHNQVVYPNYVLILKNNILKFLYKFFSWWLTKKWLQCIFRRTETS